MNITITEKNTFSREFFIDIPWSEIDQDFNKFTVDYSKKIKNLPNISYKNDFHSLRFIDFDVDYDGIPDSYDLDTSRADQYKRIKEKDFTIVFSEIGVIVNLV